MTVLQQIEFEGAPPFLLPGYRESSWRVGLQRPANTEYRLRPAVQQLRQQIAGPLRRGSRRPPRPECRRCAARMSSAAVLMAEDRGRKSPGCSRLTRRASAVALCNNRGSHNRYPVGSSRSIRRAEQSTCEHLLSPVGQPRATPGPFLSEAGAGSSRGEHAGFSCRLSIFFRCCCC